MSKDKIYGVFAVKHNTWCIGGELLDYKEAKAHYNYFVKNYGPKEYKLAQHTVACLKDINMRGVRCCSPLINKKEIEALIKQLEIV